METDCAVLGIRRAEGGVRAISYKTCYSPEGNPKTYRPLFFYKDKDKEEFEKQFEIIHSDCYKVYGFRRTGCVGCPFNINIINELDSIKQYEPKLYKACWNLFGESYEYTKKYRAFQKKMKNKGKALQLHFWDDEYEY